MLEQRVNWILTWVSYLLNQYAFLIYFMIFFVIIYLYYYKSITQYLIWSSISNYELVIWDVVSLSIIFSHIFLKMSFQNNLPYILIILHQHWCSIAINNLCFQVSKLLKFRYHESKIKIEITLKKRKRQWLIWNHILININLYERINWTHNIMRA